MKKIEVVFSIIASILLCSSTFAALDPEFEPGDGYQVGDKCEALGLGTPSWVENFHQDLCASGGLKSNLGAPGVCAGITQGGRCYYAGFRYLKSGVSVCSDVSNDEQDRCTADSIKHSGMVAARCFSL